MPQPISSTDLTPARPRRRRLAATQRALKGALLGSIFTPTGFIAKDFVAGLPSTERGIGLADIPAGQAEQQQVLQALRDDLVEGRSSTLDALAMAALAARGACVRAKRPVRSDLVAAALRVASTLTRATNSVWPSQRPSPRSHFQLGRLGWGGIGPTQVDVVYDAYADALQTRAPYVANAVAVAAVTLCFDAICLHRRHPIDLDALFRDTRSDLLLLLTMALSVRPASGRDLTAVGGAAEDALPCEMNIGRARVTLQFDAGMDAVVDLSLKAQPWTMTAREFWALCAAVLCGDPEMAAHGAEVQLTRIEGPTPFRLRARGVDWRLRPTTLVHLQEALSRLLSDERSRRQLRRLELTVGAV